MKINTGFNTTGICLINNQNKKQNNLKACQPQKDTFCKEKTSFKGNKVVEKIKPLVTKQNLTTAGDVATLGSLVIGCYQNIPHLVLLGIIIAWLTGKSSNC